MHTHLTGDYFTGDRWVTMPVYETAADWAVRGTRFARDTLEAGSTTVRDAGALPSFPDLALMKAIERRAKHGVRVIKVCATAGVKMAFGTDAGVYPYGDNGREFAALVARDLPEAHVLKMATVNAADLLGVDDRGVIAPGKRANLIAVPGNPLEDVSVMEDVRFVMKQGVIYRQE